MKVSKEKEFKIAYLINEKKLREIESIIKGTSDKIEYTVNCIDGTTINFESLDDLMHVIRILVTLVVS